MGFGVWGLGFGVHVVSSENDGPLVGTLSDRGRLILRIIQRIPHVGSGAWETAKLREWRAYRIAMGIVTMARQRKFRVSDQPCQAVNTKPHRVEWPFKGDLF